MLNFKANHRKVLVVDTKDGSKKALVTSANPHDGSSAHSNIALVVGEPLASDIFENEKDILRLSGKDIPTVSVKTGDTTMRNEKTLMAQVLTEKAIKRKLLAMIEETEMGDSISIAIFYISDKDLIKRLREANARGVRIRIIMDPNKDAFGFKKNGVPNRPVAHIITKDSKSTELVRWYGTSGEQFHTKMALVQLQNGTSKLLLGSANFTRRNLENYNLELDIFIEGQHTAQALVDAQTYFDILWNNTDGTYTLPYSTYAESSVPKQILYLVQETIGLGSF